MSPIIQDDIVRDSIIKNKERTKSYWEQLMLTAAETNSNKTSKPREGESATPSSSIHSNSNRNSVCSNEDAGISEEMKEVETELRNVKEEKRRIEREIRLRAEREAKGQDGYHQRMEEKIALELEEMRQREEELRKGRGDIITSYGKSDEVLIKTKDELDGVTQVEDINSQDGSNYSEYGSEEKEPSLDGSTREIAQLDEFRRAQSMESVSSGHSSGSGATLDREKDFPRRRQRVTVRPFEDPEDDELPLYKRIEKETPIEREIRTAREREEQLRKEKGIVLQEQKPDTQTSTNKRVPMGRKDALENDTRGVQYRLATNRIQHEIEENSEKENQLRTEGKILTTSQETVDSKVTRFTQLAEHAIQEGQTNKGRKMKRSASTVNLSTSDIFDDDIAVNFTRQTSQENQRKFSSANNSQRGIMERFIASKGRMSVTVAPNPKYLTMGHTPRAPITLPTADLEPPPPPVAPTRNGFRSAEEKIQDELREMRMREEELRLQRAHSLNSMAMSQPNLLSIDDEPEEEMLSWRSHETREGLQHALSNPNLLDNTTETPKIGSKGYRKRFTLLEQWENRIQSMDV